MIFVLPQALASEAQELLEAATRLLLVTQHASEGAAAGLEPRIAAASQIGAALRNSQEALDRVLKAPTLTSGERVLVIADLLYHPVYHRNLSPAAHSRCHTEDPCSIYLQPLVQAMTLS